MKAIATNSYESRIELKDAGFTFDKELKAWVKEFASKEEFENWYNKEFTNPTYIGRKAARYTVNVKFELIEEVVAKEDTIEELPLIDQATKEILIEKLNNLPVKEEHKEHIVSLIEKFVKSIDKTYLMKHSVDIKYGNERTIARLMNEWYQSNK